MLRMVRERKYKGQGQQMSVRQEQPKPILGSQPPPPRATSVKYIYPVETGLEMVSSKPYYQEEEHQRSYSWEDFADMRTTGNDFHYEEINLLMLLGPGSKQFSSYPRRPPPLGVKCFKCSGDHWA